MAVFHPAAWEGNNVLLCTGIFGSFILVYNVPLFLVFNDFLFFVGIDVCWPPYK